MSAPQLDVAFVTAALGSRLRRPVSPQVVHTTAFTRAIIDSREAAPGDLFVALPGLRNDGAEFIGEAVSRRSWTPAHWRWMRLSRWAISPPRPAAC